MSFESSTDKKHKKEKKAKRQEPIECYSSADEVIEVPKVKKHKKDKEANTQVALDESVSATERKSKKEKKHNKEAREAVDESYPEPTEKVKKEKKSKKTGTEIEEEAEQREETVVKSKKEKKAKREAELVEDSPRKLPTTSVSVSTPAPKQSEPVEEEWEEDQGSYVTGGANYWKRIDEEKYKSKVEGTKFAKISHYDKGGDSWGNDAADMLGKVKGKGFVKAMQKLKRASWKGQGSLETGVNSVQFSDWED